MSLGYDIFWEYLSYGLSVIPCEDKRPKGAWKEFQKRLPEPKELVGEKINAPQIACICGRVSGGLTCLDFDVKNGNKYDDWCIIVTNNHPEILSKCVIEQSPSGGYHAIFRTDTEIRNTKLANNLQNMATIETRGEGGYFVCSPSPGYVFQYGDFSKIQKLSSDETEFVLSAAISLNELVKEKQPEPQQTVASYSSAGLSPFDDYNQRSDVVGLLVQHGWKELFRVNAAVYLQRPGKDGPGVSATWNKIPDRLYCFTTSTSFENQHVYKASAVYAILEHGGDYKAAAKMMYDAGYGERSKRQINKAFEDAPQSAGTKEQHQEPTKIELKLLNTDTIKSKLLDIKLKGYQRGKTTGWKTLDKMFSVAKKQFTVITGVPSSGKSEFMDALAINLMVYNNWKFAVFSPENYPAEMHYHKLIEKITGKELRDIEDEDIEVAIKTINEHFFFIDALEEEITLESILEQTKILIDTKKIDALIIDPWNEIELYRPSNLSESDFIGRCLRVSRKFARRYDIHLFIIAHPTKLMKNKEGEYPIPELWDISGCHDEITEVLTTDGWIKHPLVTKEHSVCCFDMTTSKLKYLNPTKIWKHKASEEMVLISNPSMEGCLTSEHDLVVKGGWTSKPSFTKRFKNNGIGRPTKYDKEWTKIKAGNVASELLMPWSCGLEVDRSEYCMSDEKLMIIGWYISEGWESMGSISICQAVGIVQKKMKKTIKQSGMFYSEKITNFIKTEKPMWVARIKIRYDKESSAFSKMVIKECGIGSENKKLPSFVNKLSDRQKQILLSSYLEGDGSKKRKNWSATTVSKQLANDIMKLSIELGMMANISYSDPTNINHKRKYQININSKERKTICLRKQRHVKKIPYSGNVYCLTVPTGAYLTRRNGKPFISGNSAHWRNKADNGICVHRDYADKCTVIFIQKVKFKYFGCQGECRLYYDEKSGRYLESQGTNNTHYGFD